LGQEIFMAGAAEAEEILPQEQELMAVEMGLYLLLELLELQIKVAVQVVGEILPQVQLVALVLLLFVTYFRGI